MGQAIGYPKHLAHAGQGQQMFLDQRARQALVAPEPQIRVGDDQAAAIDRAVTHENGALPLQAASARQRQVGERWHCRSIPVLPFERGP